MIDLREKLKEAILHHLVYIITGFKAFDEMSRIMFGASFIIFFKLWKPTVN